MRTAKQLTALANPPKRIGRNAARKLAAFIRQYLSTERVEFVKAIPCAACGIVGFSENAHLLGNDGISRKGPYTEIGPLCGKQRHAGKMFPSFYIGCHRLYDEKRDLFYKQFPKFNPGLVAAKTEAAWQSHLARTAR